MSILDTIVAHKRAEVATAQKNIPPEILPSLPLFGRKTFSLKDKLQARPGIIAEFKRQSPSRKLIRHMADPAEIVPAYATAGAAAVSVLTDTRFFSGSSADLLIARGLVDIPLLRKDFMIDPYQFYEAKAWGADVVLLIAAILSPGQVSEFAGLAHSFGMEVLLELHDEQELGHICDGVDMVGINNRNLRSFEVSLDQSIRLAHQLPGGVLAIAESGISTPEDMLQLKDAGFSGFLVGEAFMRREDPGEECRQFTTVLNRS